LLTPRGIEGKARFTGQFLKIKMREYEALRAEIEQIRADVQRQTRRQAARHNMGQANENRPAD
jgi:hypothetical protein